MALCDYSCNSLCGVNTACVSQIPPSEVVVQPPPFRITIPGPIIMASPEPVAVAANNPCATPGYVPWGYGSGYGACRDSGYGPGRWGCNPACSYPSGRYGCKDVC